MANKNGSFFFRKNGIFYFIRRVPVQLQRHYITARISFSLKTRSKKVALVRSKALAARLDDYWFRLQMLEDETLGKYLNHKSPKTSIIDAVRDNGDEKNSADLVLSFSGARQLYLRLKGQNRTPNFYRTTDRDVNLFIGVCGDKPIDQYVRADAVAFRDHLLSEGLSGQSIVRVLSTIKAILNFASTEIGISNQSSFSRLYVDRSLGKTDRQPISLENIRKIQDKCIQVDDEKRWIIALVADTGMRLGEAIGLLKSDFRIVDGMPVVDIRPHPWRRLKTKNSERTIPLVGSSLWATKRILNANKTSIFAFPCYNRSSLSNTNSASATLNKWLNSQIPESGTLHGFRHSCRDRLRAIEAPSDIVDQIGGWTTSGIGHSYGKGYPLAVLHRWLLQIANPT